MKNDKLNVFLSSRDLAHKAYLDALNNPRVRWDVVIELKKIYFKLVMKEKKARNFKT